MPAVARVDVVVVTYNSREVIRACVEPLCSHPDIDVIVVDNNSSDGTLDAIAGLAVHTIPRNDNLGFAFACNRGWRGGRAPFVVFLNPDTRADAADILGLADVLAEQPAVGAVGPLIHDEDGHVHVSQRRFPRAAISLASAFFVPRLRPSTRWSLDIVAPGTYERSGSPDWVSGACVAVPRALLETIGGLDERFFMYYEDADLGRRVRDAGFDVRFEPRISIMHVGGASAPRARLIPVMTESRILYAEKHGGRAGELRERAATVIYALTHMLLTTQGAEARRGYKRALTVALRDDITALGRDPAGSPRLLPASAR